MKKMLTRKELCELLGGIHSNTLRRKIKSGEVCPPIFERGKLLFDPDALDAWVKSRQQAIPAHPPPASATDQHRKTNMTFEQRQCRAKQILLSHSEERGRKHKGK